MHIRVSVGVEEVMNLQFRERRLDLVVIYLDQLANLKPGLILTLVWLLVHVHFGRWSPF